MATAGLILLIPALAAGFFLLLLGLPGTWIILAAAVLYAWAGSFETIPLSRVLLLACMALAGEGLEYLLGAAGARRYGASGKGILASLAGGMAGALLGAPFFLGLGALAGLFAGAFLGTFVYEWMAGRGLSLSLRSGMGAFWGRVSGTLVKMVLALIMIWIILRSVL